MLILPTFRHFVFTYLILTAKYKVALALYPFHRWKVSSGAMSVWASILRLSSSPWATIQPCLVNSVLAFTVGGDHSNDVGVGLSEEVPQSDTWTEGHGWSSSVNQQPIHHQTGSSGRGLAWVLEGTQGNT